MRFVLTAALLVLVALGGCVEEETPDPGPTLASEDDADPFNDGGSTVVDGPRRQDSRPSDDEATDTPTFTGNAPPSVTFTADLASGAAPLALTFSFNASDAEGDAIAWALDADGDGSPDAEGTDADLPGSFTATFDAAGVYKAAFTASDAENTTEASFTVTVNADAPVLPAPIVFSGLSLGSPVGCLFADGDLYHFFDPAIAGVWVFSIEATSVLGAEAEWWAGESYLENSAGPGVIPAGADNVAVCDPLLPLPVEYTLTLAHPDYVAGGEAPAEDPEEPEEPASEEETLCPTDTDAVEVPGAGLYITVLDTLSSPGSIWIYEESNGIAGLQRNDETVPTSCPTPDTIIF